MNTAEYLLTSPEDHKVALITRTDEITYGELKAAAAYLQVRFLSLGAEPLDRIGILSSNSLFWVASYLAAMGIGAIAVPFATTLSASEFQRNNACVNCSILCVETRLYRKVASWFSQEIKVVQDDLKMIPAEYQRFTFQPVPVHDDTQDAAYMFTSGTTAVPRVVRVTHRNIQANTGSIIQSLSLDSSERMLAILPFYYCFGTSLLHTHLRTGSAVILSGPLLYPERTLDFLEERHCTGFAGVPSIFQTFLRNTTFPTRRLPELRKIQQAGGKLSEISIKELIDCRPDSDIYIMYGQTEATARLSCLEPSLIREKIGSIGKGIPGVQLRVINEKGDDVAPGETGEITAWGENISPGYLNDEEANSEKFVNGALKTGDLATVDQGGYITIVDRKSDFIKSLGNRVSSQQVEAYALEIKDIVSAAAIGMPDLVRGEAIILFVTLRSGSQLQPDQIIRHIKSRAASYMVPKDVIILKSLPTNANGKVMKSELKQLLP